MNDQIIVTNRLGDYEVDFDFVQPESGQIKLTVIDDQGLIATDTVSFTSVQVGFSFVTLQIFPQNDHLLITSSNTGLGFLQESNDWLQWTDVALLDTNRFVIPLTANRRFYRVHFQSNPSAPAAQTSHTLSNVRHGPSSSRRYTGDNPWRNARCSRSETFFFPQTGRKVEPRKSPSW
jgi:hypothetical protein